MSNWEGGPSVIVESVEIKPEHDQIPIKERQPRQGRPSLLTRLTREHEPSGINASPDGHCVTIVIRVTPCPRTFTASRSLAHFLTASRFLTHASSRPGKVRHIRQQPAVDLNQSPALATTVLCSVTLTPVVTRLSLCPQPVLPRECPSPTALQRRASYPWPGPFIDGVNSAAHIPLLVDSMSLSPDQMQHLQPRHA
jgi:hypothetical protein